MHRYRIPLGRVIPRATHTWQRKHRAVEQAAPSSQLFCCSAIASARHSRLREPEKAKQLVHCRSALPLVLVQVQVRKWQVEARVKVQAQRWTRCPGSRSLPPPWQIWPPYLCSLDPTGWCEKKGSVLKTCVRGAWCAKPTSGEILVPEGTHAQHRRTRWCATTARAG